MELVPSIDLARVRAATPLGDSHEEVTDLLHLPGQSACGEHPGLWRQRLRKHSVDGKDSGKP